MKTRIQKILAQAGYGSRRSCEILISEQRVKVNGIPFPEQQRYIILHKPKGVLSAVQSSDRRPTVRSLINLPERLYPVGRLDFNSEGLILMTNDGELTNQLTHPRYKHEKEYRVLVLNKPSEKQLNAWRKGIILDDKSRTLPAEVWIEKHDRDGTWLGVILKEGKNRQIRRMGESSGLLVKRIIRVRISSLKLGELKSSEWRDLTLKEINDLKGT